MDNPDHPLQHLLDVNGALPLHKSIQLHCHKDRYRKSLVPHAAIFAVQYMAENLLSDIIIIIIIIIII